VACAVLHTPTASIPPTVSAMLISPPGAPLYELISLNRDDIIHRCRGKVASRSSPPPTKAEIEHGVPVFLDQLVAELRHGPSATNEMSVSAIQHGRDLSLRGFTVEQVVRDYGDVCQSVTDLAVERGAPISAHDFRTLNRCLDDAIAGAVTEFAQTRGYQRGAKELSDLTNTALSAFEALSSGRIGVGGITGGVLKRSLDGIRALLDRSPA
jgi:hypothetical protein